MFLEYFAAEMILYRSDFTPPVSAFRNTGTTDNDAIDATNSTPNYVLISVLILVLTALYEYIIFCLGRSLAPSRGND